MTPLEPALRRLLPALLDATRAGRITWRPDGDDYYFAGAQAQVRLEGINALWPRLVVLDRLGDEVTGATPPSGDPAFDAGFLELVRLANVAADEAARAELERERSRIIARDAVIERMLAELEALGG